MLQHEKNSDMLKDLVVQYYTMTESIALAASVSYFLGISCSRVGLMLFTEHKTQCMCEAFGSLHVYLLKYCGVAVVVKNAHDISHRAKKRHVSLSESHPPALMTL